MEVLATNFVEAAIIAEPWSNGMMSEGVRSKTARCDGRPQFVN
jgi:hypothetical protein